MEQERAEGDRKYVDILWRRIRAATMKMLRAEEEWLALSDSINDWLDKMHIKDIKARTDRRSASVPLQDAWETWKMWQNEVTALGAALNAESVAPKLLGLEKEEVTVRVASLLSNT